MYKQGGLLMGYKISQRIEHQNLTKRVILAMLAGVCGLAIALSAQFTASANSHCVAVSTSKGNLTAAQVGGNISGEVDATGCDVGAYFNADSPGQVMNAEIHDANQYGVFVDGNVAGDTKVDVTGSEIYNIGNHSGGVFAPNGGQTGLGVYYAGFNSPGTVNGVVSDNAIHDYQKGGIAVNGSNASANVNGNDIDGLEDVPFIAQNGIQFGYGANGQARGNTVNGNWYTGANWASTGILVFESDNIKVDKNTVENNQVGISMETWCFFGVPTASNNKVVSNNVLESQWGVSIAAYSFFSDCDASANNNKVTNNTVSNSDVDGSEGIFVGTAVISGSFEPEANNNKVIHNSVSGFATPYSNLDDTDTKVHANAF
jgi:hypothetical protein